MGAQVDARSAAIDYFERESLTVYPFAGGTKAGMLPGFKYLTWGKYRDTPQTGREVATLFGDSSASPNLAIIGGTSSDNLAIIEADSAGQFEAVGNLLAGYGISTWTMQRDFWAADDPHAGGGHYYIKTPAPVKTGQQNGLGVEVRGQGAYVLAPPSIHPSGARYVWLTNDGPIARLDSLAAIPELNLQPATLNQRRTPRLAQAILEGDSKTIGRYGSRSQAEAAAVSSLIRAGYGYDMVLTLFNVYPAAGKFAEQGERWLRLTYDTQRRWLATVENDAQKLAKSCQQWATAKPWPGRTGSTDRAVYLAHCQIVNRTGKNEYHASVRELAELAGLNFKTASFANHRLIEGGLIELAEAGYGDLANRFSLVELRALYGNTQQDNIVVECTVKEPLQQNDAFRRRGLGKSGLEIYAALQRSPGATPAELAEATGRGYSTVKKKLAQFAELDMAESDGGRWRAHEVDLDYAAAELGTAGALKRQKQRHTQQRRLFKAQMAMRPLQK